MPWTKVTLERRQLYDEVWTESVAKVSQRYGVSNTGLSKICKRFGIPIPGRGYWARIAAGWTPLRDPLPMTPPDQPTTHTIRRWLQPTEGLVDDDANTKNFVCAVSTDERIAVPQTTARPHPLVSEYESALRRTRQPLKDSFFAEHACLDVRVSGAVLERALRIMSALLHALEERGFPVEVTLPRKGTRDALGHAAVVPSLTGANILGTFVSFRIEEQYDVLQIASAPGEKEEIDAHVSRTNQARRPNGRLTLRIIDINRGSRRVTWAEGKKLRVEDSLNSFIRGLIATAANRRAEAVAAERAALARSLETERRAEEQHRLEQIEEMRKDLRRRVEERRYAEEIRDLVHAVEVAIRARGQAVENNGTLGKWLAWAEEQAELLESSAVEVSEVLSSLSMVSPSA